MEARAKLLGHAGLQAPRHDPLRMAPDERGGARYGFTVTVPLIDRPWIVQ